VDKEIAALKKLADDSIANSNVDTYFLSLVAASLYNLNQTTDAQKYMDVVVKF